MGISSKWIKLLVRTRKKEKAQNAEKCGTSSATESPHKQKHSMDPEAPFTVDLAVQSEPSTGDTNMQTISNSTSSTSTSLQVHVSQTEHMKEDWAATVIQSAFRAFLARRALHALKGIVRLQALVRGHAVRKQAAETLKCMEALAKAQARMRTRQVHIALESQVAQKKVPEQECRETHVQEIAEGWCDGIGSVEEMQAKVSRRQEAAAKRERARAYALTHQWQAGSRQQKAANPQGLEMDQEYWRCDWLERWMAVRPWENRLLDNNSKESVPMHDGKQAEENEVKAQNKLKCKVPISTTASNSPSKKKGVKHKKSYSDVSGSPSGQSASTLYSTSLGSSRLKPKPSNEISEEVSSQPSDVPSQSISNTNERMMQVNTPDKKRLSLPNGAGGGAGKGAANKSPINRPTTSKTLRDVPKPDPKPRPNPPNPAGKPAESQA